MTITTQAAANLSRGWNDLTAGQIRDPNVLTNLRPHAPTSSCRFRDLLQHVRCETSTSVVAAAAKRNLSGLIHGVVPPARRLFSIRREKSATVSARRELPTTRLQAGLLVVGDLSTGIQGGCNMASAAEFPDSWPAEAPDRSEQQIFTTHDSPESV